MSKGQTVMPTESSSQAIEVHGPGFVETSSMVPIAAGKDRIKCLLSYILPQARPPAWRIVMDFDPEGDLLSYWECSLDPDGKELTGGGIARNDTGPVSRNSLRLSPVQISALVAGLDRKLARSTLGWLCDVNGPDEPAVLFRTMTVKSLHKRGLLDANFDDMRVHDGHTKGVQNLDGARHAHSPESLKFEVWTSDLGTEVLKEIGLLPDDTQILH
jgi:hypothetical protein